MEEKAFAVYILTNHPRHTVLYIGVTSDLRGRMVQHREGMIEGFTKKYSCKKLVYFETTQSAESAILREKQIKGWSRDKKVVLIGSANPEWRDLYGSLW